MLSPYLQYKKSYNIKKQHEVSETTYSKDQYSPYFKHEKFENQEENNKRHFPKYPPADFQ